MCRAKQGAGRVGVARISREKEPVCRLKEPEPELGSSCCE